MNDRRSKILDAARGASALAVAICHTAEVFWYPRVGADHWTAIVSSLLSGYAVAIFFALSGYMITLSLFRYTANGEFDWRGYARARAWRIYPPMFYALALTFCVIIILRVSGLYQNLVPGTSGFAARIASDVDATWYQLLGSLTLGYRIFLPYDAFVRLNGSLWTLSAEAAFYVAGGLAAFALCARRSWPWWCIALGFSGIFLSQYRGVFLDFCGFAAIWLLGSGWCIATRRLTERALRRLLETATAIAVVCLATMVFRWGTAFLVDPFASAHGHLSFVLVSALLAGLLGAWFVAQWPEPPQWLSRSADYSYTLYVFHFPLLILAYAVSTSLIAGAASLLLIIAFCAYAAPIVEWRPVRSTKKLASG